MYTTLMDSGEMRFPMVQLPLRPGCYTGNAEHKAYGEMGRKGALTVGTAVDTAC